METRKGITESGFEYKLTEEALDNMELVDALSELEDNPLYISKVVKLLLGDEQRKSLYDHVRAEDGRVPTSKIEKELSEIMLGTQDSKN